MKYTVRLYSVCTTAVCVALSGRSVAISCGTSIRSVSAGLQPAVWAALIKAAVPCRTEYEEPSDSGPGLILYPYSTGGRAV